MSKRKQYPKDPTLQCHEHMRKEIRELYPNWIDEIDGSKQMIGFTADMDGLLCAAFAQEHLGLEVGAFYDFKKLYKIDTQDDREIIYFDCAVTGNQKTFDNHLTRFGDTVNTQSANINNVTGVHLGRYTDKYAMSTLIQLYALYNIPLPETPQGKLILLCCDVGFKGYYDSRYRDVFVSYLEMFNMTELIEILEQYTQQQMYEIMLRAQMNMAIQVQRNGELHINMNSRNHYGAKWLNFENGMDLDWFTHHLGYAVELPEKSFTVVESFITKTIHASEIESCEATAAFSYAFINSRTALMSIREEVIK